MIREMNIWDYMKNRSEGDILVDIRDRTMFGFGTVPGAVNIPVDNIKELYSLPRDKEIYIFCQSGEISGEIAELLSDSGCNVCNLTGGYREYLRQQMLEQE